LLLLNQASIHQSRAAEQKTKASYKAEWEELIVRSSFKVERDIQKAMAEKKPNWNKLQKRKWDDVISLILIADDTYPFSAQQTKVKFQNMKATWTVRNALRIPKLLQA